MTIVKFNCGCMTIVKPLKYCAKHAMANDMIEAINGLLDGLEANTDGRDGLTQKQWDDRIQFARETFNKATE